MLTEGLSALSTLWDMAWRALAGGLILGTLATFFAWAIFEIERARTILIIWAIAVIAFSWVGYCELQWFAITHSSASPLAPPARGASF